MDRNKTNELKSVYAEPVGKTRGKKSIIAVQSEGYVKWNQ